ncbi:GTP-binding protein, putative [Plasmodium ovale wallikeri]|uniref:GTP-binding protein, putative n=1 Tax=Plasmodium ovale wallikeri TaxID=864142 RepID=A0A1A8Z2D2_PLAOA|nr:GTP-binding protein, putative [Plasmodium ovale wallikeri]SBT37917.1 GTP-binding protein, putative [Plasmodium ovale wallikeri]
MGVLEKIKEIEAEMARTQKNKATEYHLGQLKAKLAKYRSQLLEAPKGGKKGDGFDVQRQGDARICLIGFPSVGKSTLLSKITRIISYKDAKIQLLDLPGIIQGAAEGRGRGRQVIAVAKSCDMIMMILDATRDNSQKLKLENELKSVGIRINQEPQRITLTRKKVGGVVINSTVPLTKMDNKLIMSILHQYKIHNCNLLFNEDATVDDLIDVIEGNRKYIKCIYVYNKIDMLPLEEINAIASGENSVVISSSKSWNLDILKEYIFQKLEIIRVYTKVRKEKPDFTNPITLTRQRGSQNVEAVLNQIHKDMIKDFKFALVWGRSTKHNPQRVDLHHKLADEDVIQIAKNS